MALLHRLGLLLLLSSIVFAADIVPNKLILKLAPYAGKLQSQSISSTQEIPDSVRQLNEKYQTVKIKAYGTDRQKSVAGQLYNKNYLANFVVIEFSEAQDINRLIKEYEDLAEIKFSQPVYRYRAIGSPDDQFYDTNQSSYMDLISANQSWDITTGNSSAVVAIIDSGIQITHEDLSSNIWVNAAEDSGSASFDDDGNGYADDINGWDFVGNDNDIDDAEGHGTFVAGIVGAVGSNHVGIAGICWDCQLMGLRVLDQWGYGDTQGLVDAINYATGKGVDIINLSLGQTAPDSLLEAACNNAQSAGILLVAAMGNVNASSGVQKDTLVYPAAFDSVMGVGAVDSDGSIAEFSVIGSYPATTEISAPGVEITSTFIDNTPPYATGDGTSFAAPLVSGVAALVKSVTPGITLENLRSRLRNTANDAGRPGKDSVYGYGILNAYNAVTNTLGSTLFASEEIEDIFNFPNPITGDKTTFIFTARNNVEQVKVLIYDFRGELKRELTGGSMLAGEYRIDWDLTDKNDNLLNNGSYIYIMEIEDSKGSHRYKEVLSIAR